MNLGWKLSTFIILCAALVLLVLCGREYIRMLSVNAEIKKVEQQKMDLQREKSASLDLIEQLSSTYYVEKEGRTKQGLAGPGETVVVITGDEQGGDDVVVNHETPRSNIELWFAYFFRQDLLTTESR